MVVTNPRPLATLFERSDTREVQPVTAKSVQVCGADPMRVGLVVFADVPSIGELRISPDPSVRYGVEPLDGQSHVVITHDEYPLLIQQEWYITSPDPAPTPIYVIEIRRHD